MICELHCCECMSARLDREKQSVKHIYDVFRLPEQQTPKSLRWLHVPTSPHSRCEHIVADISSPTHDKSDSQILPDPRPASSTLFTPGKPISLQMSLAAAWPTPRPQMLPHSDSCWTCTKHDLALQLVKRIVVVGVPFGHLIRPWSPCSPFGPTSPSGPREPSGPSKPLGPYPPLGPVPPRGPRGPGGPGAPRIVADSLCLMMTDFFTPRRYRTVPSSR